MNNNKLKEILENIKEKWVDLVGDVAFGTADVFLNPGRKEIVEASDNRFDQVRFIADSVNKNFYIWSADAPVHHGDVGNHEAVQIDTMKDEVLLSFFDFEGGKLVPSVDFFRELVNKKNDIRNIIHGEFDWLYKYHVDMEKLKEEAKEEAYFM